MAVGVDGASFLTSRARSALRFSRSDVRVDANGINGALYDAEDRNETERAGRRDGVFRARYKSPGYVPSNDLTASRGYKATWRDEGRDGRVDGTATTLHRGCCSLGRRASSTIAYRSRYLGVNPRVLSHRRTLSDFPARRVRRSVLSSRSRFQRRFLSAQRERVHNRELSPAGKSCLSHDRP